MRHFITMALTLASASLTASNTAPGQLCHSPLHALHFDLRHTESKGLGYSQGYTTLAVFGIYDYNDRLMPFFDLRGHLFNNGKLAGNIGIGERTFIPSITHIFGFNLYYDVRQASHDFTVHQISPGVELLGRRMEYRLNAYFPVSDRKSSPFGRRFTDCAGFSLLTRQKHLFPMKGFDGEIGGHLTQSLQHDVYWGLGPYYLTSDAHTTWGGKGRLFWRYRDYISLEATYSYDHLFKNIVQGTLQFSYPFGGKLKRSGKDCPLSPDLALSRASFAPYRFEIPALKSKTQHYSPRNPVTGRACNFAVQIPSFGVPPD